MANYQPKVKELFVQLQEGVADIRTSDDWRAYLTVQAKFHTYSFRNVILINRQFPSATRVAGFSTWTKQLKRQIIKGSKAIKIMAPHEYTYTDPDTGKTRTEFGCHQASVFDISQTTGEPLPELCPELKSDTASLKVFYEHIKDICPVPIGEKSMSPMKGYYNRTTNEIFVKKGMSAHQKCKTAIHEIAHAMLHNKEVENVDDLTKEEKEIQAEGTAFVVLTYFGFDTSAYSFPYIASWANPNDPTKLLESGKVIQRTACTLIEKLNVARTVVEQSALA